MSLTKQRSLSSLSGFRGHAKLFVRHWPCEPQIIEASTKLSAVFDSARYESLQHADLDRRLNGQDRSEDHNAGCQPILGMEQRARPELESGESGVQITDTTLPTVSDSSPESQYCQSKPLPVTISSTDANAHISLWDEGTMPTTGLTADTSETITKLRDQPRIASAPSTSQQHSTRLSKAYATRSDHGRLPGHRWRIKPHPRCSSLPSSASSIASCLRSDDAELPMDPASLTSHPQSSDDDQATDGTQAVVGTKSSMMPPAQSTIRTTNTATATGAHGRRSFKSLKTHQWRLGRSLHRLDSMFSRMKEKLQPRSGINSESHLIQYSRIAEDVDNLGSAIRRCVDAHETSLNTIHGSGTSNDQIGATDWHSSEQHSANKSSSSGSSRAVESARVATLTRDILMDETQPATTSNIQHSQEIIEPSTTILLYDRSRTPEMLLGIQIERIDDIKPPEYFELMDAISQLHLVEQELENLRSETRDNEARMWRSRNANKRRRHRRSRDGKDGIPPAPESLTDFQNAEIKLRLGIEHQRQVLEQSKQLCMARGVISADRIDMYSLAHDYEDERLRDLDEEDFMVEAGEPEWTRPYSRFILLVSFPGHLLNDPPLTSTKALKQALELPTHDPSRQARVDATTKEFAIETLLKRYGSNEGKLEYINRWMLHKLRLSAHEAEILVSTLSVKSTLVDVRLWQQQVLYFWDKDGKINLQPRRVNRSLR